MAKPHKFAWNGIDVETSLGFEQLANMAQRAAQESTGDLLNGKHRIAHVKSSDRQIEFRINDYLISFKKYLVFYLDFEDREGRTWMSSRIDWYVTSRPTVGGFIPIGFTTMVAHHTYLQFVRHLAEQVKAADPQARVRIREGTAESAAGGRSEGADQASRPPARTEGPIGSASADGLPPLPPSRPRSPYQQPPPPPPRPAVIGPGADRSGGRSAPVVTSVPGMPSRSSTPVAPAASSQPSHYDSVADQLFAEDARLSHTRAVLSGGAVQAWSLRLPNGVEVPLRGALVLGRNPVAPPGAVAKALPIGDPHRSVSKTHALLELRDGLPWLTDLNSTNGTTVTNEVGEATVCEPGIALPLGEDWVAGLGEYNLRLIRQSPQRH